MNKVKERLKSLKLLNWLKIQIKNWKKDSVSEKLKEYYDDDTLKNANKIILIGHSGGKGGAETLLKNMINEFRRQNVCIAVLVRGSGPIIEEYRKLAPTFIIDTEKKHHVAERSASFHKKIIAKFIYDEKHAWPVHFVLMLTANCSQYQSRLNEENVYGKLMNNSLIYEVIFNTPNTFKYELRIEDIGEIFDTSSVKDTVSRFIPSYEYSFERKLELEVMRELLDIDNNFNYQYSLSCDCYYFIV